MISRRTVLGLILCLLTLGFIMACAEPGPAPPPPPPMVEPPPPSGPPIYFVNVSSLALREGPTTSARQITTLSFNDEVELLDSSAGWGRVYDIRRGFEGWASLKYLQPAPADRPRPVYRKRTPSPTKEPEPKATGTPKAM
jgi:hypothetical protein